MLKAVALHDHGVAPVVFVGVLPSLGRIQLGAVWLFHWFPGKTLDIWYFADPHLYYGICEIIPTIR